MAEHDQNDEYQFVEFDEVDSSLMEGSDSKSGKENLPHHRSTEHIKKDIKRNASIALGLIISIIFLYKIIAYFVLDKKEASTVEPTQALPQVISPPKKTTTPVPSTTMPATLTVDHSELDKKVAAIELSQQNLRSDLKTLEQDFNSVNSRIDSLNNQMMRLNQAIDSLSSQLTKQADQINALIIRAQAKRTPVKHLKKPSAPSLNYYLQAVIPGRAWIIATNGSTLTIRKGTKIAGYGTVRLIDPLNGRVLTSSGRVIKFSQEDS